VTCRPLLPLVALTVLLAAGCSDPRDSAAQLSDCGALAADVAELGLNGTPTQADAEAAVKRLDDRLSDLKSPEIRDAAGDLRDRVRELQEAARSGDSAATTAAIDRAREAAESAAEACGLPADALLGR
jgi:hypothetical protein